VVDRLAALLVVAQVVVLPVALLAVGPQGDLLLVVLLAVGPLGGLLVPPEVALGAPEVAGALGLVGLPGLVVVPLALAGLPGLVVVPLALAGLPGLAGGLLRDLHQRGRTQVFRMAQVQFVQQLVDLELLVQS
jgi:hypothetical protein